MKSIINTIILSCLIHPFFSQNTGEFKVSFEFTKNQYAMKQLNSFLLDTLYNGTTNGYFKSPPTNEINSGNNFGFSILYRPLKFQTIGIYGGYQLGKLNRVAQFETIIDPFTSETETINGQLTYTASSIFSGVTTETIIDELIFDNSKRFWEKASWIIAMQGGVGYSMFRDKSVWSGETSIVQIQNYNYNSIDFHGKISMNFEYELSKNPLITSLGIKCGYQFLKTKNIKNDAGETIINTDGKEKMNLDFSGAFLGVYFNIGK